MVSTPPASPRRIRGPMSTLITRRRSSGIRIGIPIALIWRCKQKQHHVQSPPIIGILDGVLRSTLCAFVILPFVLFCIILQDNPSACVFCDLCLFYSASVSVLYFFFLSFLFASRSGGSALVLFFLLHFTHICHEDQVCLAARDMNLDVECPSLCLRFVIAVR